VVEALGALAAAVAVGVYGLGAEALAAFALLHALTVLACIDIETGYLPDAITFPLIGAGLLHGGLMGERSWRLSLAGALIAGGSFLLLRFVYAKLRGREGLGGGDVKLFAAGGAWCGPFVLPSIVLIASLSGLLVVGSRALMKGRSLSGGEELRFGPYLAAGIAAGFLVIAPAYPN
jgi:leader peptidase (prepilin peptidase)/N-methyltransferase